VSVETAVNPARNPVSAAGGVLDGNELSRRGKNHE
jgi:hypothetical protein